MSEWPEDQHDPPASGGGNPGVESDVESEGDEGSRAEQASPPIADDAAHEQTQAPALQDDVGVPPDDELAREERSDG